LACMHHNLAAGEVQPLLNCVTQCKLRAAVDDYGRVLQYPCQRHVPRRVLGPGCKLRASVPYHLHWQRLQPQLGLYANLLPRHIRI
jgi:hypothetical protein